MSIIALDGHSLTIDQLIDVACYNARVAPLSEAVKKGLHVSQDWIKETVANNDKTIYGINTGFGPLSNVRIAPEEAAKLSRNVILACLVGVGPGLPVEIVRAMMLVRANTLCSGHSGVRPLLVQTLLDMLNSGVTPFIPSKGSLGASGDLAPLAHMAVVLTRDVEDGDGGYSGQAYYRGELMSGAEAMHKALITRVKPEAKEGLALCNGTTFMISAGAIAIQRAMRLLANAEIAAALSLEALTGLSAAFHPQLQKVNRLPGQVQTAANIRKLVRGSQLVDSEPERVQDAYTLRCTPQVLGPIRHTLEFVRGNIEPLLNGATDNPLIFKNDSGKEPFIAVSGGNFHGEGIAMWLDFLGIAVAEIGNISERRTFRMVTPELNNGLPAMLVKSPGLNTGLMMPQYTAAALVSDNKTLAHPDSVDSIPSSANQEDHVSMGANAARHTLEIIDNTINIVAIELLTAIQAIDLRPDGHERLGQGTGLVHKAIRNKVSFVESDRQLDGDIKTLASMIRDGDLLSEI
ncbi:histidine ammonia-lyase [Desulfosarcina sp.]|uniref:histidine ammonia-lyase n=1 Tax=Desulfosarcina sp. TaxID=2027861 RepID=UPI0029AC9EA5|nr:histidine ammonia-lyase [Desulfosarcina sp.]MDX2453817.1 histidine ammonia-lyase [Desulfosarcina sp.]MDX2491517.1 histidine ammonia-lyase [Desulfosarcina sp.]